jgi:nicotinate-nucleotide pyrophosphorylase (carboxylating)
VRRVLAVGGVHRIMLDNYNPAQAREAVEIIGGRFETEASGGIRLDTIGMIAATGVNYISVGRLTQSAPAADIGLDFTAL